jgi:hypothetical protein
MSEERAMDGSVANFHGSSIWGESTWWVGGLGRQSVELFGRGEALFPGLDHQLLFLEHVHEFNAG